VLSLDPSLYGLYTIPGKEADFQKIPFSLEVIQQKIRRTHLADIYMNGLERVVYFSLERRSPAGSVESLTLVFEAISRWSNLILIRAGDRRILASWKSIHGRDGSRSILPGHVFEPPPGDRKDLWEMTEEDLTDLLTGGETGVEGADWVSSVVAGLSPATAADIFRRLGNSEADPRTASLFIRKILDQLPEKGFITKDGRGRPRLALSGVAPEPGEGEEEKDLLAAAGDFYRLVSRGLLFRQRSEILSRKIRRRIKQQEGLLGRLQKDLWETERAGEYREMGSLVMAHMEEIKKGDTSFITETPFGQPGSRVEVPLDPKRSPAANAELYFKRARKLKARAGHLGKRIEKLKGQLTAVREFLGEIGRAEDLSELQPLEEKSHRLVDIKAPDKGKEAVTPAPRKKPAPYLEYISSDGYRIIVGRNSASNDYVFKRVASPGDLWCHAEGHAGAHVVVKDQGSRKTLPQKDLNEACMLAAYHSKARDLSVVPVSYTRRKYVHRPKGAGPGAVVMLRRKTVFVPPSVPPGVRLKGS
jgi:predicted ribosome quality control (RQC) complex YloA/Tae2 family protein